jgi:hypothetical protein
VHTEKHHTKLFITGNHMQFVCCWRGAGDVHCESQSFVPPPRLSETGLQSLGIHFHSFKCINVRGLDATTDLTVGTWKVNSKVQMAGKG